MNFQILFLAPRNRKRAGIDPDFTGLVRIVFHREPRSTSLIRIAKRQFEGRCGVPDRTEDFSTTLLEAQCGDLSLILIFVWRHRNRPLVFSEPLASGSDIMPAQPAALY